MGDRPGRRKPYAIPRDWAGETVVCVASGQSLTRAQIEACLGRARIAVVNDGYLICPEAGLLYAADDVWWDAHEGAADFAGEKWTCDLPAAQRHGLRYVKYDANGIGLSRNPAVIHGARSSGHQLVNLVALRGAARILLLGYDMHGRRWFGQHPKGVERWTNGELAKYKTREWVDAFAALLPSLREMKIQVVNCSPGSAVTAFPRRDIRDALAG